MVAITKPDFTVCRHCMACMGYDCEIYHSYKDYQKSLPVPLSIATPSVSEEPVSISDKPIRFLNAIKEEK